MARPCRVEYAGALYHVMNRGNRRERVFRKSADYEKRGVTPHTNNLDLIFNGTCTRYTDKKMRKCIARTFLIGSLLAQAAALAAPELRVTPEKQEFGRQTKNAGQLKSCLL